MTTPDQTPAGKRQRRDNADLNEDDFAPDWLRVEAMEYATSQGMNMDEIECDQDALLSHSDDAGTWVQCWVFVPKDEDEDQDEDEN